MNRVGYQARLTELGSPRLSEAREFSAEYYGINQTHIDLAKRHFQEKNSLCNCENCQTVRLFAVLVRHVVFWETRHLNTPPVEPVVDEVDLESL